MDRVTTWLYMTAVGRMAAPTLACSTGLYLPTEVYVTVLSNLCLSDLAALARCSRSQNQIVLPILYKTLSLRLWSGDPDPSSALLLQTLSTNSRLRYYIRHVEVVNNSSTIWTLGHSKLLGIILSSILTYPERITSFAWKAGQLQTHMFFPEMVALECTKVLDVTDLLWARWHLVYCRTLKSIRLHLSRRASKQAGQWFLSQLSLQHVKDLCLQGADLSTLPTDAVHSLESLELKFCHGLEAFLARLVANGVPRTLKVLKIAGSIALGSLGYFLSVVASKVQLEELSLRIGGVTGFLSTKVVRTLTSRLSTLVLDFRRDLCDPRTSLKYTIQDFQDIVRGLPHLKSVGIALDLRNPKCRRYQRTKYTKDNSLELSGLEYLHLRGHCVPLQRSVLDAKHLARPFAKTGRFSVLLDHGSRLRKLNFSEKSFEFAAASDDERSQLSTDLYGLYG